MSKKEINICLVNTVYSLFLYFLIEGYNENDIFIFTSYMPNEISDNIECIRLPHVAFVDGFRMDSLNSVKGIINNVLGYCRYFYGYFKLRILLFIKTFNKKVKVYGHAHTPFSYMFYENENSNVIEDGLMNYSWEVYKTHKINPVVDMILHLCGVYFLSAHEGLGSHVNIKNVYLTQENNDPLIKDKVKIIDIKKRWESIPVNERNKIMSIFNINIDSLSFNEKTVLILTGAFYNDNLLSYDEEVNIYGDMIRKFENYTILIKPHPRDTINYKEIFNGVEVLDRTFPIEILTTIGFKPNVVCAIVSTALLNFKESEIYIYEGEIKNKEVSALRDTLVDMVNKK
ncbi:MAG: hypothetical protein IJL02_01445 [Methanobrevibacter sp.]|uniref:glycosyltransferase family 52 n=1 Tax=Methanobrevibacter sp. TaxID=66852 RepID=UPI0025CBE622|nr:glycosyltransferase family 52 [Methanobrevibacter sp.]MBQ6098512.1 hypothetical protein [Methanobrevibacter sp.]